MRNWDWIPHWVPPLILLKPSHYIFAYTFWLNFRNPWNCECHNHANSFCSYLSIFFKQSVYNHAKLHLSQFWNIPFKLSFYVFYSNFCVVSPIDVCFNSLRYDHPNRIFSNFGHFSNHFIILLPRFQIPICIVMLFEVIIPSQIIFYAIFPRTTFEYESYIRTSSPLPMMFFIA